MQKKIKCTGKSFKIKGLSKKKTYYMPGRAYKRFLLAARYTENGQKVIKQENQ